jgi:hypothetical protein
MGDTVNTKKYPNFKFGYPQTYPKHKFRWNLDTHPPCDLTSCIASLTAKMKKEKSTLRQVIIDYNLKKGKERS